MEITQAQAEGRVPVTIFQISGAFNADQPLSRMVQEAFNGGARNILLDLSQVSYISSAGLRVLHTTYTMLRDSSEKREEVSEGLRGGTYHSPHLKLLNPSKMVMEALQMSGYDMFIESFADRQKAVDSF